MPVVGAIVGLGIGALLIFGPDSSGSATESTAAKDIEVERLRLENEKLELKLREAELKQKLADVEGRQSELVGSSEHNVRSRPVATSTPAQASAQRTLAFWKNMNTVIRREAAMRATPGGGVNMNNADQFLANRVKAYEYAVSEFDTLETTGVDPLAVKTRDDVRAWYQQGVNIGNRANQLMGSDVATRKGTAGLQWKAAEMKHNADVAGLNRRAESCRQKLVARFGIEFPGLE